MATSTTGNAELAAEAAARAGFTGETLKIMVAIAGAESGYNPANISGPNSDGSHDYGLWQINDKANADVIRAGTWNDPNSNAQMAMKIYKRQGLCAWSTYAGAGCPVSSTHNGKYKDFLKPLNTAGLPSYQDPASTTITNEAKSEASVVGDSITGALNAVVSQFAKLGSNLIVSAIALALFIVGIMLIKEKSITKVATNVAGFSPVGKVGNAVKKVGNVASSVGQEAT